MTLNDLERRNYTILYAFNAAALSCRCASFLQLFSQRFFSLRSPQPLYLEIP